jgi:hypothetical protein
MKDLHISTKCSLIAFGISALMLVLLFLSLKGHAQVSAGLFTGYSRIGGHVNGIQINNISTSTLKVLGKERQISLGIYIKHFKNTGPLPDYKNSGSYFDYSKAQRTIIYDKITVADYYEGLSIGITLMLTKPEARHPFFLSLGIGNVDRTILKAQTISYAYQNPEHTADYWIYSKVNYDMFIGKCLSPEVGAMVSAYSGQYLDVSLGSSYKYRVGFSGILITSVKIYEYNSGYATKSRMGLENERCF